MQKRVIGIVGNRGAGKNSFIKELDSLIKVPFSVIYVLDILIETLQMWDIPQTTYNLQHLAQGMRGLFGDEVLVTTIKNKIEKASTSLVFVNGVRGLRLEKVIRSFKNSTLIYIETDQKIRYERIKQRNDKKDESIQTFDEFLKLENFPPEQQVKDVGSRAEYKILNNGDYDEFRELIKDCVLKLGL